ncbi:MAG: hypothetical protein LCH46_11920 [Proteobacteria bacterium]|nr:hypothetical protein [Pseudomonadota bacterium]
MTTISFLGRRIPVPGNIYLRVPLGILLVLGGFLGFLPVLGFWMLPFGLLILSIDFPPVRRFRRHVTVKLGNWIRRRWPSLAARLGLMQRKDSAPGAK